MIVSSYTCPKGHRNIFSHRDVGAYPKLINCPTCIDNRERLPAMLQMHGYDLTMRYKPEYEFYRPTMEELMQLQLTRTPNQFRAIMSMLQKNRLIMRTIVITERAMDDDIFD